MFKLSGAEIMKQGKLLAQKFDYDIGYLVKSPCRDCGTYGRFPECMDRCADLDRIQAMLSNSLPSGHNHSALESFALQLEVIERV